MKLYIYILKGYLPKTSCELVSSISLMLNRIHKLDRTIIQAEKNNRNDPILKMLDLYDMTFVYIILLPA